MHTTYTLTKGQLAEWMASPIDAAMIREEVTDDVRDMGLVGDVDVIDEAGKTLFTIWQTA